MFVSHKVLPADTDYQAAVRVNNLFRSAYPRLIIAIGAIVLLVSLMDVMRHPVGPVWLVLACLTLLTGWATLRMPVVAASFSVSDTFTITAALLFGPSAGAMIVTLDSMMMWFRLPRRNRTRLRLLFNVTAPATAMWVSAHAFFAMSGTGPLISEPAAVRDVIWPLAVFAALYFLLNTGMVATAVAVERDTAVLPVWREHFSMLWLTYFGGASIATLVLLAMAARVAEAITLVLVAPLLALLYATFKMGIDRIREKLDHVAQLSAYAAALRSTADGVMVTDTAGRITLMNPMAERMTGWSERDARGRPEAEIFRMREAALQHRRPNNAGGAGEGAVRECVLIRADGTETAIEEVHAAVRDEDQNEIGAIRTFRDVSQRKAIEAEREALLRSERRSREAADEANRMKDEFLATLSHELRTPANAVLGWARLLKTGRMDEANTRQALEGLERSARAQASVLDDLLDMSRIVRGTLRLEMRHIDVLEPLREAVATIEPALLSKDITLRLDAAKRAFLVDGDPDRLRQVFWNLLSNAVKFSDDHGSIVLTVSGEGTHVQIDVVDQGVGIRPEVLPFIFDRFRQGDSSTTRAHTGLGLGLAIVRHLVELHGGTVGATSEGEGRGARFTVRLPIAMRRSVSIDAQRAAIS
jgi:PAS domain S-box-containing protein